MKRILLAVLVGLFLMSFAHATEEKGSSEEAVALVKKAVAIFNSQGREKAFEAINDPKGEFQSKDLYVWVIDIDAKALCLARPVFKQLIGQELIDFQDVSGRYFMKELVETAKSKGSGWVDYVWANPLTKKHEAKSTYFETVKNITFCCGYYK